MSEPKLISPLLDGYSIGAPISDHDGVRCCPALKEGSDKKYIVKIISIPASQVQLDALLLTGAYLKPDDAMDYFKELSDGVEKEAECLKNLAKLEGFESYEDWQVVPMENGSHGYEIYLLGSYKYSLDRYTRRNTMTQREAVNLGIDICNALCTARRAGWIYADLKPSNIFITDSKEYRIGDLGLMELEGLDLASLPGKYRSAYSAPELQDEMISPNTTMDTYALGLILYQIFNNGQLPQVQHPTEDPLPPPENADYEMAEILLRACAPVPADRWESPLSMGQALVAYLQRNLVADDPIIPPRADLFAEEAAPADEKFPDETLPGMNDEPALVPLDLSQEMSRMMDQADELICHTLPQPPVAPEGASVEELEAEVIQAAEAQKQAEAPEIPVPVAEPETDEPFVGQMPQLMPEREPKKPEKKIMDLGTERKKERRKGRLAVIAMLLILSLALGGGYWFYNNHYLQMIDGLSVEGTENQLTVVLDTQIDNSLLTVVCTDTYGNTTTSPVEQGRASFPELLPDMLYKIRVEIEGFHRLSGSTTHEYMTPAETRIVSCSVVTGPEDGSAIVSFTVDGPDSEEWTLICSAEGEETLMQNFTGHTVTIRGLTVGKTYTMELQPTADLYLMGENTLEFTAASIVIAENLAITTDGNGVLSATWSAPEGTTVAGWTVRCYSTDGYDQTLETTETTAAFRDISLGSAYTVEVTAAGMTQPARAGITANPLTITNVQVDDQRGQRLNVSWEYDGKAPEGGWLLMYTIDGNGQTQIVPCQENNGVIEVWVPAATYDLTIQAADGSTVFDGTHSYRTENADIYHNDRQMIFEVYQSAFLQANLLKTPAKENWNHRDVGQNDFTSTFRVGDRISLRLRYSVDFYIYREDISIMYVIRDAEGKVVSDLISVETKNWNTDMWNGPDYHFCCLNVPKAPTVPGEYTLCLYFDGMAVTALEFTVTE